MFHKLLSWLGIGREKTRSVPVAMPQKAVMGVRVIRANGEIEDLGEFSAEVVEGRN
jgi:hypothetical protein